MNRPMRCDRVQELLDDHVDGLLPAEDAESVRDHLDACRECRETAVAARAASTSLASWGDHEPPPCCFDQILAKIDALPPGALSRPAPARAARRPARRFSWRVPALAAAAAAVAVVAIEDRTIHRHNAPPARRADAVAAFGTSTAGGSAERRTGDLLPGEERVHIDRNVWDSGIRRTPGENAVPTLPVKLDDRVLLVVPR
jgi:anti-sigma-K factor RskA